MTNFSQGLSLLLLLSLPVLAGAITMQNDLFPSFIVSLVLFVYFSICLFNMCFLHINVCIHFLQQLPSNEMMLSLWKILLSPPDESEIDDLEPSSLVEEPSLSLHILAITDLLLIYDKCFPQVLNIPSSINFLADIEQILINENDIEAIASVQERILKLMISLDSFAFTPDKVSTT